MHKPTSRHGGPNPGALQVSRCEEQSEPSRTEAAGFYIKSNGMERISGSMPKKSKRAVSGIVGHPRQATPTPDTAPFAPARKKCGMRKGNNDYITPPDFLPVSDKSIQRLESFSQEIKGLRRIKQLLTRCRRRWNLAVRRKLWRKRIDLLLDPFELLTNRTHLLEHLDFAHGLAY